MYVKRNNVARSCNSSCSGKATSITYPSVCNHSYPAFNAHAPCHIVVCGVRLYIFPHHLINGTVFGKILLKICAFFLFSLQLLSETFLILSRTERHMIINVYLFSSKVPVILVQF